MVLGSVAISVWIKTPEDEGPRVVGDRITINHLLDPKYMPRHFNGSWISGNYINHFKNAENYITASNFNCFRCYYSHY